MTIKETLLKNIDDITKRYNDGQSISAISKFYNTNSGNIYPILKDIGILRLEMGNTLYGKSDILLPDIKTKLAFGYSAYRISKELKAPKCTILRIMKKHNLSTNHLSTQREDKLCNHTDEIITLFNNGMSANQIAIKFDAAVGNILKILNNAGLDTSLKMYSFDETFFDKIDSEVKAWVLGLIYTDGNNRGDDVIRLCMTDLDIIEKVREALKAENPISFRPGRKSHHKTQYTIAISRKGISDKLTKLGCMPNKTFLLKFPNEHILPANLHNHFIRGALDGDGSISNRMLSITGAFDFLSGVDNSVYFNIGIRFRWYNKYPNKGESYNIRMIAATNKKNILAIADFLYRNASIYGNRRFNVYKTIRE
jgi:protein-tyrosine-phosphatase